MFYSAYINFIDIVDGPDSVNVSSGSIVQLSCIGVADGLAYYINDTAATNSAITDKGFSQSITELISADRIRRNLTFTATSNLNRTNILCRAVGDVDTDSDVAVILIQGTVYQS